MSARTLYLVRHGAADAMGELTQVGVEQSELLGDRLAGRPIDVVWHSPLPRAAASAAIIGSRLRGVLIDQADELIDAVPTLPPEGEIPPLWRGFFDGYEADVAAGRRPVDRLTARFGARNPTGKRPTHEVLVTHAYQVAWLVREALGAPESRWMSLTGIANAALTVLHHGEEGPPTVLMVNDTSHLPEYLRWTGFPAVLP